MSDAQPIAVAVVEQDDQFLIGQRPSGVPLAGLWEFPGGKVRPGEAPEAAAVRECYEEAGLNVAVVGHYPPRQYHYPHGTLRLHFYHCQPTGPTISPRPPFVWVPRATLPQYAFPEANGPILQLLSRGK
jgi:8-oxo-dGTP diphosphatase